MAITSDGGVVVVSKIVKRGMVTALLLLLPVVLFLFYWFDPATDPFFPLCLFRSATGLECPGCGSQRAIHSLLHLRFGDALAYNALMVLALPYILLGLWLEWLGSGKRFPGLQRFFFGRWSALVVLLLVLLFWIGRNIF
ncbi:MAG: DUF2752 domain-containing protein [Proteiniphilum sp.]|nr:DUF2752 domain-containing protein [Proteiniphilum sp.]MDD3967904.1 DUF2752 domain-containing protein [Proteiniphilum sp.]MDD4458837.1 DUF2752 domain-containing protein [Proteiniphilum sp.]